ncbi:MAG: hypothetical protein GX423_13035 [Nitrospiraceae bacterium]|nr:hypothetical protein [Nitrospiraceae bacterium]
MPQNTMRYMARVSIEFTSPFLVAAGRSGIEADDTFVVDANGLPAIPGSSIAGAIRDSFERRFGRERTEETFGFQRRAGGQGSRLSVSWACIHDGEDRPVERLRPEDEIRKDDVLSLARTVMPRPHVRIGHTGAGEDSGLFSEIHVAAGNRFTFELLLSGNEKDREVWRDILSLLNSPGFRLGGKSRRGYGAFRIVRLHTGEFNLMNPDDFGKFCAQPVSFQEEHSLSPDELAIPKADKASVTALLDLKPEGFWMVGGGTDADDIDLAPTKETVVVWKNDRGSLHDRFVLPASAVKGPLSHRVAFYCNAASGAVITCDEDGKATVPSGRAELHCGENNAAVRELFGEALDHEKGRGRRGCVIIGDLYLSVEPAQKVLNHVSIDRYTGGARSGMLFTEKPFYKGSGFRLQITVQKDAGVSAQSRSALQKALTDLAEGRLGLGSGNCRGNGFFTAPAGIQWSDNGEWIGGRS